MGEPGGLIPVAGDGSNGRDGSAEQALELTLMAGEIRAGGGDLAEVGDDGREIGDALAHHDRRVVLRDPATSQLAHDHLHGGDGAGGLAGLAPHEVVVVGR